MTRVETAFLLLLKTSACGFLPGKTFPDLTEKEWEELASLAARHGLTAVTMGALEKIPKECLPQMDLLMDWLGQSSYSETVYQQKKEVSAEFADALAQQGVKCIVLKGLGVSRYYPNHDHREFGDFDCYLLKDGKPAFEIGMHVARELGARINGDCSYKHQQITYKDLLIENHQFISNFDDTKEGVKIEKILRNAILADHYEVVEGTSILIPPAHFQALHLLKHALDDFLDEGLLMRQIYDWAMFLKAEQHNLNWEALYADMKECRLKNFCDILTLLSLTYLGLELRENTISVSSNVHLANELLKDTLEGNPVFTDKSILHKSVRIFNRMFVRMWKFRSIATESYPVLLWKTVAFSSYMHRKVELK